jgi:hypothetical protein
VTLFRVWAENAHWEFIEKLHYWTSKLSFKYYFKIGSKHDWGVISSYSLFIFCYIPYKSKNWVRISIGANSAANAILNSSTVLLEVMMVIGALI